MLQSYFADMHIHIGRDMNGKPVKITGAKSLTLTNILQEASRLKGIDLIGVIDCHVPAVQEEIKALMEAGQAYECVDGGIRFETVTLLLGSEIEIYDENCQGPIHVLCFLPTLKAMETFTNWLTERMTNIHLSSQRLYANAKALQYKTKELGGLFIPAHVFTPFKSLYGKGVRQSLTEVFDPDLIDAIELGLSSDTSMADHISELHRYTYLSNSDAHSLGKIAREYQALQLKEPSFKEFYYALHHVEGRAVTKNFGMNPQLGKYYTTVCQQCFTTVKMTDQICPACGSSKIVNGVFDRIQQLKDHDKIENNTRPPYIHHVPLDYLPSLGPKTYEKLLTHFQTEMNIIHHVSYEDLIQVIPEKLAKLIIAMRAGKLTFQAGGGGKYGKVTDSL